MERNKQSRQAFSDNQGGMGIGSLFGIDGMVDNSASTGGGLGRGPGNTAGVRGGGSITNLMQLLDPTYRSGFDYARSIAGGMPMEQVIAPGVSYSPEQPGGYTQAQLNTAIGMTPVEPPPPTGPTYKEGIEDMIRIPPSERGVTIPVDRKMPPLRDIFGGVPTQMPLRLPDYDISDIDIDAISKQIADSGIDFTNLFGLPKYETPDLSEFVRKEDIPSFIPDVPTGREFSIEDIRSGLDLPDFTQFARQEDIPTIPTYQAPDLSGIDTRLADLERGLIDLKEPTGGRFSISQPRPMGLF